MPKHWNEIVSKGSAGQPKCAPVAQGGEVCLCVVIVRTEADGSFEVRGGRTEIAAQGRDYSEIVEACGIKVLQWTKDRESILVVS